MGEMVERIAKELHSIFDGRIYDDYSFPWEDISNYKKDEYREDARRVIEMMREPTEAMIYQAMHDWGEPYEPEKTWQIMIDEALK